MQLRYYQREGIDAVLKYWENGGGNPLLDYATGTGKSVFIAALLKELITLYPDIRIIVVVHVRELVKQNVEAILRVWPKAPIGINCSGLNRRDKRSQILYASIQSVYKEDATSIGYRHIIFVDEAHLIPSNGDGMYRSFINRMKFSVPDLRVGGCTATPYRLGSGRLDQGDGRIFDDICYTYGIAEGVKDGYLLPLISTATSVEINMAGAKVSAGEFNSAEVEKRFNIDKITNSAVDEIVDKGRSRKSWLLFCSGVKHAYNVRDALRMRGISSETVTADTPLHERDHIIYEFKSGKLRSLTNDRVLSTGIDIPSIDLICLLMSTLSTNKLVQMLGRGTRLSDNKEDCLCLDYGGNIRRHGPIDDISIAPSKDNVKSDNVEKITVDSINARACPKCKSLISMRSNTCKYCGHEFPLKPKIEARADPAPIMASLGDTWLRVDRRDFFRHTKDDPNAPPSLRAEYWAGLTSYREWIPFEHPAARGRARAWWQAMSGELPVPLNVIDAIGRAGELDECLEISLRRDNGKYWKICGHRIKRKDGRIVEINEQFRIRPLIENAA